MIASAVTTRRFTRALVLVALLPVQSVWAAKWSEVAVSPGGLVSFYVDHSSISGTHVRSVSLLYDYRDVQQDPDTLAAHRSSIVSAVFDCSKALIGVTRIQNFTLPMGVGKPSQQRRVSDAKMNPIASGSIDARIGEIICRGRRGG